MSEISWTIFLRVLHVYLTTFNALELMIIIKFHNFIFYWKIYELILISPKIKYWKGGVACCLNLNQSKSTDYQWNLTDSNSWKEVTVNQSNFTDYFSENWLICQWNIFFHWWISEKSNHWFNQWKFDWFRFRECNFFGQLHQTIYIVLCDPNVRHDFSSWHYRELRQNIRP